jgi:AcrR family transcriptional regulator
LQSWSIFSKGLRMGDTRSALLDAAVDEFARHGFEGARVQAIVRRAGVNERMIYHHFGSKAGLYAAALEDQLDRMRRAWKPALDRSLRMSPYAGMRSALTACLDLLLERPTFVGLMLQEALGGWRTIMVPDTAVCIVTLRELYVRGQADGVFCVDCPFELACPTAMGSLFGSLVLAPGVLKISGGSAGPAVDLSAFREQILRQLLEGMTRPRLGHCSTA